jgi:hypothetical protein
MDNSLNRVKLHITYFRRVVTKMSFIILILIPPSLNSFSQFIQIQARIVDSSTYQPVAFVTVYTGMNKGTISDELGYFRLQLTGDQLSDSLHLSCIGYKEQSILLKDLDLKTIDTIFMRPYHIELDAVEVKTEFRKAPGSKKIIRRSISQIPDNYPDQPVLYRGYYREYVKQEEDYINLLESIIDLEDPGISMPDEFSAGLLFKRINKDFRVDRELMRPYDNVDKLVPYSTMPTTTSNELVILRSHDPVRNFNEEALYYIDCLKTDFIRNHDFNPPKLTYLNDRPYYYITFSDRKYSSWGSTRIFTMGSIYIDALNYGIKKINYQAFAEAGINSQKLFELNVEYEQDHDLYRLNYLSFNNLFMTRNFFLRRKDFQVNIIDLTFNRPCELSEALNRENYRVFWKDEELTIRKIEAYEEGYLVRLILAQGTNILKDKLRKRLNRSLLTDEIPDKYNPYFEEDMRVEIVNVTDLYGNPLMPDEFNNYYQYRELFIKDYQTGNTVVTSNLIDRHTPVFESSIFGEMIDDTLWLNTPLIAEETTSITVDLDNKAMKSGLENLLYRNEKTLTELVYIHSDREVYAPSDTLWFKAYIRNKTDLLPSDLSNTLFVKIVNGEGKIVDEGRFLISDSKAHGQFILDHALKEGIYYLTGHSSWMHNFSTDQLFSKRILVRKDRREGFQLVASYDRPAYFPGDTMIIRIQCYNESNRRVDDVKYSYRITSGDEVLQRGRANTSLSWLVPLEFIIPGNLKGLPEIMLNANHKNQFLDTIYTLPVHYQVMVDFYPEGGHCINGLITKIAFKSQTPQGEPVDIQGVIVDQNNNVLKTVRSEHDGMGFFTFLPVKGNRYYLRLTRPAGVGKIFPIPEGVNSGWQLSARSTGDRIHLSVNRQGIPGDTALITVMVRGHLHYYRPIAVEQGRSLEIPAKDIPAGIAVVTLFDHRMWPRAERLVYVNPAGDIGATIETDRTNYIPRDKVSLKINLSSNNDIEPEGSYSLSVIDDQLCSVDFIDEPDIRSSFLLSPEIKGKIHDPDYYLLSGSTTVLRHLDLLLMTQGWRDYSYINTEDWAGTIRKPTDREVISGYLMRQPFGRELTTTAGELLVYYAGNSTRIPVNESGRFSIKPLYDHSTNTGLLISATDDRGSYKVWIDLDSTAFELSLSEYLKYLTDSLKSTTGMPVLTYKSIAEQFSLALENHEWIEEVVIRAKKISKEYESAEEMIFEDYLSISSSVASKEEIESSVELYDILINMGKTVEYAPLSADSPVMHLVNPQSPIGWVIDDVYYGIMYSRVNHISPQEVDKLFFIKWPETQLYGSFMPEVIVSIKLKKYDEREIPDIYHDRHITGKFIVAKEFYKPLYDTEEKRKSTLPDLRKTIHWEPDLKIAEDGTATIDFYNGDRYTKIRCILEGITDTGIPVYAEQEYNVTLLRE